MVSEILRLCPEMVDAVDKSHETPIHECCRNGNVQVLMLLLAANPKGVANSTDQMCIYMAASRGHTDKARHQYSEQCGITARDILDQAKDSAEKRQLQDAFSSRAGGKRSTKLSSDSITPPKYSRSPSWSRPSSPRAQADPERSPRNKTSKFDDLSPKILRKHKELSKLQRENLNQLYYTRRNKNHKMHGEGLLNARNTVISVAILLSLLLLESILLVVCTKMGP